MIKNEEGGREGETSLRDIHIHFVSNGAVITFNGTVAPPATAVVQFESDSVEEIEGVLSAIQDYYYAYKEKKHEVDAYGFPAGLVAS